MKINEEFTALAIIKNNDQVLVVERRDWPQERNLSFPGGKAEGEERPEEVAARELFEETGLALIKYDFVNLGSRPHPKITQKIFYCVGKFIDCSGHVDNLEPEKHLSVGFRPIDEVITRMGRDNIFPPVLQYLS